VEALAHPRDVSWAGPWMATANDPLLYPLLLSVGPAAGLLRLDPLRGKGGRSVSASQPDRREGHIPRHWAEDSTRDADLAPHTRAGRCTTLQVEAGDTHRCLRSTAAFLLVSKKLEEEEERSNREEAEPITRRASISLVGVPRNLHRVV